MNFNSFRSSASNRRDLLDAEIIWPYHHCCLGDHDRSSCLKKSKFPVCCPVLLCIQTTFHKNRISTSWHKCSKIKMALNDYRIYLNVASFWFKKIDSIQIKFALLTENVKQFFSIIITICKDGIVLDEREHRLRRRQTSASPQSQHCLVLPLQLYTFLMMFCHINQHKVLPRLFYFFR